MRFDEYIFSEAENGCEPSVGTNPVDDLISLGVPASLANSVAKTIKGKGKAAAQAAYKSLEKYVNESLIEVEDFLVENDASYEMIEESKKGAKAALLGALLALASPAAVKFGQGVKTGYDNRVAQQKEAEYAANRTSPEAKAAFERRYAGEVERAKADFEGLNLARYKGRAKVISAKLRKEYFDLVDLSMDIRRETKRKFITDIELKNLARKLEKASKTVNATLSEFERDFKPEDLTFWKEDTTPEHSTKTFNWLSYNIVSIYDSCSEYILDAMQENEDDRENLKAELVQFKNEIATNIKDTCISLDKKVKEAGAKAMKEMKNGAAFVRNKIAGENNKLQEAMIGMSFADNDAVLEEEYLITESVKNGSTSKALAKRIKRIEKAMNKERKPEVKKNLKKVFELYSRAYKEFKACEDDYRMGKAGAKVKYKTLKKKYSSIIRKINVANFVKGGMKATVLATVLAGGYCIADAYGAIEGAKEATSSAINKAGEAMANKTNEIEEAGKELLNNVLETNAVKAMKETKDSASATFGSFFKKMTDYFNRGGPVPKPIQGAETAAEWSERAKNLATANGAELKNLTFWEKLQVAARDTESKISRAGEAFGADLADWMSK